MFVFLGASNQPISFVYHVYILIEENREYPLFATRIIATSMNLIQTFFFGGIGFVNASTTRENKIFISTKMGIRMSMP